MPIRHGGREPSNGGNVSPAWSRVEHHLAVAIPPVQTEGMLCLIDPDGWDVRGDSLFR